MATLFQKAFLYSRIPQAVLDSSGRVLAVNKSMGGFFRQAPETLAGRPCTDFLISTETWDDLQGYLKLGKTCESDNRYTSGGRTSHALLTFSGVVEEGELSLIIVQVQDMTEVLHLERNLDTRSQELEQFTYIASHDLREPLITMSGYASLLQRRMTGLDEDGKRWLTEIISCAKNMENKINALLKLSRAGRKTPRGTFNLGAALEEAERGLAKYIEESGAVIRMVGQNPTLRGDRSMIAQVLQNLLSNSIKYRKGPPEISIRSIPQDNGHWLISVADNGLGFDMQYKDRIFQVFQRLYTIEQYPGTGVGLTISKKIIERHGGRIWPISEPGKGSTFYLTLPGESNGVSVRNDTLSRG